MCGFPVVNLDKYLKMLVQQHKRFVALCEEFSRSSVQEPKVGFDRRVVRIITPGTLIDEAFTNPYENNYLLAISPLTQNPTTEPKPDDEIGLAWTDISTGDFFTDCATQQTLRDEICRIGPQEVVIDRALEAHADHPIRRILYEEGTCISYVVPKSKSSLHADVGDVVETPGDTTLGPSMTLPETSAVDLLTTYLRTNLFENSLQLSCPSREAIERRMQIDAHTVKGLELREGMTDGGFKGSLLSVIKRTITSSGSRLLSRSLCKILHL
jgi:DNA mismatch repair ATPase MutS